MENKISKILESIIAQTAFDAARAGVDGAFKDHIALALLRNEGSLAYRILARRMAEWQIYQLILRIENQLRVAPAERLTAEEFFSNYRRDLVAKFGDRRRVSTVHALIDILSDFRTISSSIFARYGVTVEVVEQEVERSVGGYADSGVNYESVEEQNLPTIESDTERKSAGIEQFGVDMTRLARQGKIDIVVGREQEIERVVRVLARRKKNNPVLVGQAGVGKSAIVEGLALRIVQGEVPYMLLHKRLISLDVSSLIAGTKYRGEFEERIQQLLTALESAKDTILFIDEIHTIVGAGATQGALDVANILKPALSRGQIQTIGATTLAEYRQSIERDTALERRFQRVMVEPTTAEQTLEILHKAAPIYEEHHRVKYTERALVACVELADRYISERYFPDKAIDLLDEAGAQVYLESRGGAQQRELRQAIASATDERERAVRECRYNVAVEARLKEIALKHRAKEIADIKAEEVLVVDSEHIAHTLTAITGVPASRISADERTSLQRLEGYLKSRVVGQDAAIESLAKAIRRSRAGLKEESRPCGVFMFLGATGVGKTLLAKELAVWLAGSTDALIRLDMSEYSQQHNVARLFGAPPGYVGYGEGGQLTEAVRRRPYSVVLFDEIEKAHPQVFNAMLQIFDEGHLTDGEGRKVDFKNTIIIMTSNLGGGGSRNRVGYATQSGEAVVGNDYRKVLERSFSPEFINRIDEVVLFNNLSLDDARQIVAIELAQIVKRIDRLGYTLHITDEAMMQIVKHGFDERYGARSIKRMLRSIVEQPLAELLVNKDVKENQTIALNWSDNEFVLI